MCRAGPGRAAPRGRRQWWSPRRRRRPRSGTSSWAPTLTGRQISLQTPSAAASASVTGSPGALGKAHRQHDAGRIDIATEKPSSSRSGPGSRSQHRAALVDAEKSSCGGCRRRRASANRPSSPDRAPSRWPPRAGPAGCGRAATSRRRICWPSTQSPVAASWRRRAPARQAAAAEAIRRDGSRRWIRVGKGRCRRRRLSSRPAAPTPDDTPSFLRVARGGNAGGRRALSNHGRGARLRQ